MRNTTLGVVVMALAVLTAFPNADSQTPPARLEAGAEISRLLRDVERAQALRDVKDLEHLYAQFGEYGLWNEMAALFSMNAEVSDGRGVIRGRAAIGRDLTTRLGRGRVGLPVGAVQTDLIVEPVVTLSADGTRAKARWQLLTLSGRFGERADWFGGTSENEYIKEGGTWKIDRVRLFPQLGGTYEAGFMSLGPQQPFVPYHFSSAEAGRPIPEASDALLPSITSAAQITSTLRTIEQRVMVMNEEDSVRNLQNAYGYYVDRKMWDDVADLFTRDGVLEIAGLGTYNGATSIRRGLERDGPAGLQRGQVNDRLQLGTVVRVRPDGREARSRGLELGMLSPKYGDAFWSTATFVNRYVKQDGVWRIREMRIFPKMKADYYAGWAKSNVLDPAPAPAFAPDRPSPPSDAPQSAAVIPVFDFPNPATRAAVTYPAGVRVAARERLLAESPVANSATASADTAARLTEARRKLERAKSYDAIENISAAFAYYLDDYQWQRYIENYAADGVRKKGSGSFYVGRDRIFKAESIGYGPMPPDRDGIRLHTRLQPVIHLADDGRSAYLRTRMLLYFANSRAPGAFNSGMYPNDSAVLEGGVWKFRVGGAIDETYFASSGYKQGWARPAAAGAARGGGFPTASSGGGRGSTPAPGTRVLNLEADFPPDFSYSEMPYRGQGFARTLPNFAAWPDIKPMWFHYKNPVSGRVPPFYCPDILTCDPPAPKRGEK